MLQSGVHWRTRGSVGEDRKPKGPRLIGELILELMKKTAKPRHQEMVEISAAWVHAAGPDVARRSEPVTFKGGQFTVRFESTVLKQEVQAFRRTEILERLRLALPDRGIATLKCVVRG